MIFVGDVPLCVNEAVLHTYSLKSHLSESKHWSCSLFVMSVQESSSPRWCSVRPVASSSAPSALSTTWMPSSLTPVSFYHLSVFVSLCPPPVCALHWLLLCLSTRVAGHHSRRPAVDRGLVGRLPPVRCLTLLLGSLHVRLPSVAAEGGGGRERAGDASSLSYRLWDSKAQQRGRIQPRAGEQPHLLSAAQGWACIALQCFQCWVILLMCSILYFCSK